MPALIEDIAAHVTAIHYADMPAQDVTAIKRLLLDTLGCALGAVQCEPARQLQPLLRPPAGPHDTATLIGSTDAASLASAILHNGTLVRYLDFMDVYWARDICHPSENIPVAVAAAEAGQCSGRQLIEAIAAAYEVQVRLADAFSLQDMHMHHVSAAGFVAPLILGKLSGLTPDQLAHACALGGFRHLTLAALVEGKLSMAKSVGYALPASECVLSTRLAAQGFTGPLQALEGLWRSSGASHAGDMRAALDLSPGTASARRVSLKRYPVQFGLQAPIEAALTLREAFAAALPDIVSMRVEAPTKVCRSTADPAKFTPDNRETADHSLPCCVALAWLDGRVDTHQFEQARWRDNDLLALMQRIDVQPAADLEQRWPNGRPARVTVQMKDGTMRSIEVGVPLGDASRPMSDDDIAAKFTAQAEPVLGAARTREVMQCVAALEELEDVGQLCRLLRC